MLKTIEAVVEKSGRIRLLEEASLPPGRKVLVTVLSEDSTGRIADTALLSEAALAKDWNREEEDEAWRLLQQEP